MTCINLDGVEQAIGNILPSLMNQGVAAAELFNGVICDSNNTCYCKCSKSEQAHTAARPCQHITGEIVSCHNPHKLDSVDSSEAEEEGGSDSEI